MASLTVQALAGTAQPTVGAAAAGGDTTDLEADVRVVVGGTATTVTLTPVGPYVAGAPARVFAGLQNVTRDLKAWDYPGHPGSPKYGRVDITYSQVTGVSVGASVRQGV